ncbi:hypothetical protein [Pontibacter beigongshangensis]|nr:hypothetical protein [Pontibacter beigongshangensis]
MIEILAETKDDLLAVRVSKELTIADFDQYRNLLCDMMQQYTEAHLYYEM